MREVELIKQRLAITDIVRMYVPVEKIGSRFRVKCPFHNEKTASLYLSPDRGNYYCFGCGAKGDIFTFVQHFEGLDFRGALKLLAEKAGVQLTSGGEQTKSSELYKVLETATQFFVSAYAGNTDAQKYVASRAVTPKTIATFRLGYAPEAWQDLLEHLTRKGFSREVIAEAGLTKANEDGRVYDRFRHRIMFPITDSSGRTIGFTGRALTTDPNVPKYLNSPETPVFSKKAVLFGLAQAKDAIRKKNYTIIVEGQFDALLAHQVGTANTVAGSGTAFSDEVVTDAKVTHLGVVERLSKNLVLAYDRDQAGEKATIRTGSIALSLGMEVKILTLPSGKDPADCILENPELWTNALKKTAPIVDALASRIREQVSDPKLQIESIYNTLFPLIASMPRSLDQDRCLAKVADIFALDIRSLKTDFVVAIKDRLKDTTTTPTARVQDVGVTAKVYVGGVLYLAQTGKLTVPEVFRKEVETLFGLDAVTALISESEHNDQILFSIERMIETPTQVALFLEDLLTAVSLEHVEHEIRVLTHTIKMTTIPEDRNKLLATYHELSLTRQNLINRRLVK